MGLGSTSGGGTKIPQVKQQSKQNHQPTQCSTGIKTEINGPESLEITPAHTVKASQVAQLVQNPPARQETSGQILGQEFPLEKK